MDFRICDVVSEADRQELRRGLLAYNLPRLEDKSPKELGIYLEDAQGRKLAGLTGKTHGLWLRVEYLWVSEELRRQGVGSALLKRAEECARQRGCAYVFLDTFGFQAPEFYKKYGYREVFALRNYPVTGSRHYFTKEL